jgi:hypothetical protein
MNNPWYVQLLITLIPSLIVAVVTALATVKLSLRKFYTERWWERKADAYSRIVEALHKNKDYDEQKFKIEMTYPKDDRGKGDELENQWAEANAELQRAVDLGAFVISLETEEIISKFLNRNVGDPNDEALCDIIETDLDHIKKCLAAVKKAAKKDLGL